MTMNSAKQTAQGAVVSYDRTKKNIDTYQKQQAVTGGVAKSAPKWNPETGEMEQTYLTSAGTEHQSKEEAADIQRRLNDAYWREAHPLEAAEREIGQDLRDIRTEEERLTEERKAAEGRKDPKDKTWWDYFKENFAASAMTAMQPMGSNQDRDMIEARMLRTGAYGKDRQAIANEQDVLLARRRLAEEARQLLVDVRKDKQDYGFFGGLGRAGEKVLETALNPHTWDFGEADLQSQLAVANAVIKSDGGLGISQNEQKLLDTWAKNAAINSQFGDQLSGWTKAGMVTGESLPFMLEMAMNPASGLGEQATAQLVKYSLKKYGTKWVKDHAKSMLAKKIATRLIGDMVGAGVMASTTGMARVAADYENRVTGQVDIGMDANGDVIYNGIKQDTKENPGAALFKALSATSIENWSEMAGNYLGFINSFFGKALGKTVVGKAGRKMLAETGSIEGVSLNKAQKFIYELAAGKGLGAFSEGLKQFADRTQWHGVIGEYLEEEIGNIANALVVGDMTLDTAKDTGVFNLEQNIDTFCGVALMGGFMSAMNTVGYAAHKYNYDIDRVSNANAKIFGDDLWRRIKTTIDSSIGDPRGLNDTLTDLIGGDDAVFDKDGKKAILKYAQAALEKQGAEMANYQPRMASSTREEATIDGQKKFVVTSLDKNGETISQQAFDTEDEAMAYEGELKMNQQQRDYNDYLSMTNKLSYPEAAQVVDEFIQNYYEVAGITSDDVDPEFIAAINDPKSELGKQFQQFKTEKILQKAEANRQAIEAFEEENGWTPGTVAWLAEQDPMQMDAEGLQMMDQARTFLEGLAYPAGEVHVEHEQQVGAETAQAVVENVISTEEPIEPQNNAGQQITDQYRQATQAYNDLMARNEELRQEIESRWPYMSEQEVVSSLDSFKPEDVQTVIDYYNANARYRSFMDEAARQIDNVASRNRRRRTFHGTINGAEDTQNVVTITDGTNSYTLVSGNIQVDNAGNITGSDSGLIIGVDQNGDFVQLGDTSGYSVLPNMLTLDQWEDLERTRLQEAVSLTIDPNGAAQAAAAGQAQQSGNLDNAGGEAGGANATGANNPPATAQVAETQQPTPQQPQQPAVTIESVTDKDGIKRYENGISAEDAVADMVASGDNPIEVADASIAEADLAIKKINEKPTKTRKDLEDRKKHQKVKDYYEDIKNRYVHEDRADGTSYTQIGDRAILSKDGKIIYDTAGILGPVFPEGEATGTVANGEGNLNIGGEQPQNEGNVVPSQPKLTVEEQKQERIKALKAELGELFDDDFTKANDVYELVSMWVGRKRNLAWDDVNGKRGLQKELGWTRKIGGDTKYIETLLAKKGEGMGVDEFVHMVWESPENTVGEEKRWSTEEIKEALLDLLKSAASKSDVVDYALNTREAQARQALAEQQQQAEAAAEQGETEITLTDEDIAQMEANLPFAMPTDEDIPDSPIVQLMKAIEALRQREGMPEIKLVDTDRMSDDEWYDIASAMFDGAFVSQEEIETARQAVLENGVFYNEETGVITVYSDSQTAEDVTNKVNYIYEEITRIDSVPEEGRDNGGDTIVSGVSQETSQAEGGETPAAEGESSASAEPVTDNYLQPRDAEEEKIVADVLAQLQQEIQGAIDEQNKARSELQKAQARESERATDMFSDDEAFEEPGQLFSFDDMGGTDRSQEGVERRTAAERQRLQQATDKLNQLQSEQERNSRIRGALDNHRRQTQIDLGTEPQGTVAQSREEYLASHPLTEEQIMADTEATEDEKLNAIDFLRGEDDSAISRFYYDSIYNRVAAQPQQTEQKPLEPITDPMEAIEDAANLFRGEQETINKRKERWQGKREEQKSQDQADIDAALKEFDDFLDNAKGSGILDKFMRKGLEGNDKAQANLLDAFTLTNEAQRMFLKDLLRLASKVGYAYIKSGIHDAQAWGKQMSETIGRKLNEVLGWDDAIVSEFVDEVWNQKYTVDGQRMRLSEHADRLKNDKGADTTVNEHKQEDNEAEKPVSLQQEAKPTTKQGWLNKLEEVFEELCKKYGVPTEPIIFSGNTQRYGFDYRITKGYQLDQFEPYFDAYSKKLDEEVEPATDKQLKYIERLVADDSEAKKILDGVKLNKISASYVIAILKASEDAVYSRNTTADVFDEYYNELTKVAKLAGKEFLEGDSAEFARKQKQTENLRKLIAKALEDVVFHDGGRLSLANFKAMAKQEGVENISDTDLQELVEAEIVNLARDIAHTESLNDEQKYAFIVRLYQKQPSLNARDNDRINLQQYSTPAPMAFLMGKFLTSGKEVKSGLEPSAGNGMLTIGLPKESMHVNDIDEMRLSNLEKQGFGQVTSQDGLQSFGDKQYEVVVTNPPFGNVPAKTYDGLYEISGLEHQMAINALESMKDDGRAAIIIGGNTEYNQNGTIKGKDRAFLNYLYAHYNVVDVINMNGHELYSRQGTGFPVRMILINGRKEFNPRSFAPVIQKARAERVNSYDELYKRVNDDILSDTNKPASVHDTESGEGRRVDDTSNAGNTTQTGVRNVRTEGGSRQSDTDTKSGSGIQRSDSTPTGRTSQGGRRVANPEANPNVGGGLFDFGSGTETSEPSGSTTQQAGEQRPESGGNDTQRPSTPADNSQRLGQRGAGTSQQTEQPAVKRGLGTEKVPYRKQSGNPFTLQSLMPAEQADVVKKSLEDLGDVDQFLVDELGYSSKEELHQALAAEQIDSVAMAINQMNQGSAFIIGDQTGIGKGRQAAALIRYGVKKGGCPVFITVKKALFSDMYRDLCDIGSPRLRPFIWSADDTEHSGNVTDKNGRVIYQTPSAKEQKRVIDYINKNGKLPPEYDYVLTTYDSFKSGTMDYENGEKKDRKFPKGKKPGPVHFNGQAKRDALETLAGNSYVIMDESHNAGGEGSNVSNYLQYITTRAKGLTFLSATFAKRPGNMPIYSLKTAIAKAGVKVEELIDAVKRGGATLQEIMSKALTEAGQMIRRERDMTGVTIDWRGIEDESVIQKQREQYDTVIGLFNDIISFQRTYVDPIVNGMNDAAAEEQGEVDHTPGTRDMGINNTPFASRTYNMVQQVLLSLKAEEAAKRAIEHLKLGRKPVITVANTNEGAADEAAGLSDEAMEMPDLSVNLKKGLQGTMRITKKDAFGNTTNEMIPFDRLSEEGRKRYMEIMDAIENASSGLSLSPIDVIKNELKKAGYKVGELTGRKAEFVYNEDGTVRRVKRQDTDKKRIAADFNNGNLDALILNRSAGTGISLHASSTFKDQRQRIMIVAQAQGDVNDEVQIRGRIDRTGQVLRGMYEYVVSQIPSEQRLLMMLKAKLRSLDANTTSSQKSKFNEMQVQDIINKYGDDIVIQYLAEHPDLAMKMCDPLKWGEGAETLPPETLISQAQKPTNGGDGATASKVLGRMALLKVEEQEKMLAEIGELYQTEIDRLNEMGENDLEITEMPLKAKTLKKDVWEEGVEPGGKNPFADNSYVETVEMDVLKKPMKAEEVKKAQERLLGGKTWEAYKQGVMEKVDAWAEQKKADTTQTFTERAEKKAKAEQEKYVKGVKKMQDKNGMTDAEIERNGQSQYNNIRSQEMEKLNPALEAIDKQKQAFVDALETFTTDGVYALPKEIYDLSQLTFEPSFGKVIDIKIADNFSTTASTITFATMDGRRKITIPVSGMVKQYNGEKRDIKPTIVQQTAQSRDGFFGRNLADMYKVLSQNIDNWDRLVSTTTRKKGYIITGNLLKALTELRKQGKGGKLISYTTDTGDVRQGILMSDQFDPKTLTSKNPISSAKEDLEDWEKGNKIVSADKEVIVKRGDYDWHSRQYDYVLQVPKSKKKGEKYFNDKTLLSLMMGQFEGSSSMRADFKADNLDAVLKRLDELGVTVESAKEEQEGINTPDPMDAIRQAANSWNGSAKESESSLRGSSDVDESQKKTVPLERRTLKSYTDKDGNYHKGIEEELRDLESEISGRSSGENQGGSSEVGGTSRNAQSRRPVKELRKQAAKLRAEIARRNQVKQDFRKKYNIDERGNISLSDLRRLFHDLNSNKILGKLFDKVCDIVEKINTQFRFTDKLDALTGGEAFEFFNTTFFNWDNFTRNRTDQQKAKTILHELIHNIGNQLLDRYERTDLPDSVPELSASQKKLAKEIFDIYEIVDKAIPENENGEREFYGATSAYEMLSEMANQEFRDRLAKIPYRKGMNVLQKIVEWFKDVLGSFGLDIHGNTAFDSLNKALEDVIGNYDDEGIREYREILAKPVRDLRAAGLQEDVIDYVERYELGGGGTASLVEDEELIKKLEAEPKVTVYRAMQLQDGKLYPPMAAKVNGKWQDPLPLGEWSQADEHPELVDKNGKFTLDKGNGKTVAGVVYAPYMHGSTTMLNDQFKEAQDRPELVVVEAEMPESELTSGYQAEKSPRKTGRLPWKAGTIQGQLTGTRDVILSRWVKPVRIVPASEVAQSIKQMIDGQVEVMPTNVVTPEQREELEKIGVKFVKTNNQEIVQEGEHKGEQYSDAYGKKSKKGKPKRKKSVEGDPMQAIKDAASKWARSSAEREGMTPEAHSAKAVYDERLNRVETVFSEAYQDSMVSLKTAQNAIAKDKDIPDSQNAYMAENLMHGKNKNEQDLYNKMFRDPLIATINKIMNLTGMNWGDVDRYVYTKSGLERNREFYVRDWLESERNKRIRRYEDLNDAEQSIFDVYEQRIEEDFDDGKIATEEEKQKKLSQALQKAHEEYVNQIEQEYLGIKSERYSDLRDNVITFPEYLEAIDNFIRRTIDYSYEPSEHDYSGFRAMFGDEEGKYNEAAIIEELMEQEEEIEAENVDTLWEQIRGATRYGLERYRESGMRSDEQIDRIEQMFHWYVPMRGFKDNTGEDMYQYFTAKGTSKSYVGGLLKHAKGRGSEANYPISTIFAMTYKAISDCNQNLVNQKLYRLCQANPNDLIVLSDSWAVLNETTGEWEEVGPEITDDMDEEEIREATLAWEEEMKDLAKDGKAKKIKGKEQFDYKPMDKKKQSEHIVDVRINGQPRKMIVTGNPRMAQALNGQLRFERGKNVFSKWNAAIKNMMASLFTSYSPTFALRNMFRDWTHFRMMLGVREGRGYAKQANKYYRQSLFKMVGLFKKYREGTLDESNEMERDFKDFMDNGGITGFVQMQKIDDIQKQMEKLYAQQKQGKTIRLNNKVWDYTLGAIEALNEGIENNARFATFRASRHYAGRTKARSAYDAKEITVNFNRKGAGGKTYGFKSQSKAVEDAAKAFGVTSQILGEGRIFFNATVQAIATTFKNFQNPDGSINGHYVAWWAMKYAVPPFAFGLALPAINKALAAAFGGDGDDDPYANLAEWTRRKNICIYIGNNNFITIPIGQELAAFLALGDIAAGNLYAENIKPVDRSWDDEILGVLNTFSPVDIDTKITKGGIMEDPISEVTGRTFSVLAPLVAVEQNLGWTGRPIYREDKFQNDQYTPEYQMVYQSTNPVLVNASKLLHEIGGGDDITRGKLEVNPAIVQYLWEQYTGGPGKVFSNTISLGKDAKDLLSGNETDFNIRKVEGLKAFVQQGDDRTAYYRTQAKYRKYSEDAKKLYHDVKGYENGAAENPEYLLKLEQISKGDDFVRMQIVREADKQLSQINKAANKAEGKEKRELRRLYNERVAEVVRLLDEVGKD
ncbi:MAG: strawberry notch C-terminal domain-containing protein [Prevotella sp.]|nr:strawberry notch C-terminal domain-containing protein [Prevotella sp.]